MKERSKKRRTTITSIFATSILMIVIGITYAFVTQVLIGAKQLVVTAGVLDLVLEEENALTISDAYPMYDEVGMIQEPYTFRLVNNSEETVGYKLKLVKIDNDNELELSDVKYGLTKEDNTTIKLLSNLIDEVVDEGAIKGKDTINYSLRLWIRDGVEDETTVAGKSLSYKVEVEISQKEGSSFAVSFDAQGGEEISDISYMYGDTYGELPMPTRNGYTFNGWHTSNNKLVMAESLVDIEEGLTLYAKWNINTYSVTVDPNGGTWNGSTAIQQLNIEYKATTLIDNPTRVGYTFTGWEVTGTESKMENGTFTMGYENTTIKAKWSINSYKLTVNPNGGTWNSSTSNQDIAINYSAEKEIANPTREGYTFTGWGLDGEGSNLSTTTFTMGYEDTTLTANWVINQYPWIVYHYKQNIDGSNYTLVDADTGKGIANFGTEVTPEVLTYTGFTSPMQQTITIQVDEDDPPTKNKVDYNYSRNKYTLTVNPNGGSWNSTTSNSIIDMYYEETKTIEDPTKTGYTGTWALNATDSNLTDKIFTMGTSEATLTANYTANKYVVTFNANGGSVSTANKEVTYDSTYGELPTPETRIGYGFNGWFTAKSGGTQITSTSTVAITKNTTLYAQWSRLTSFAIYDDTAKSLTFHRLKTVDDTVPTVGNTYEYTTDDGSTVTKTITAIYTGIDDIKATSSDYTTKIPWYSYRESITNVDFVDEINPTSTAYWFAYFKYGNDFDVEKLNTSSVTTMLRMFYQAGYTSTVKSFKITGMDNWNTAKVKSMYSMFECAGWYATTFEVGDLSNWNTSRVTNMFSLFLGFGVSTKDWDIGDIGKWDVSKVTNMCCMLGRAGQSSTKFELDLSNWDVSSVKNMEKLFLMAGNSSTTWSVGDLSNWNTSNVTNMQALFNQAARNATSVYIGDLSTKIVTKADGTTYTAWDTTGVTDMSYMFQAFADSKATSFKLIGIETWYTSDVLNMEYMFYLAGQTATTFDIGDLSKKTIELADGTTYTAWNTGAVTNMNYMFASAGLKATYTLDLTSWDVSSVTTHSNFNTSVTSKVIAPTWAS